jgi:hypothetical protein
MTPTDAPPRDGRPDDDVPKTYLYLRLSIILAVVLLLSSILVEWLTIRCLQTSVSAYYYTPVRAILVGTFFAIGFALVVYKGQDLREDFFLNLAGMFIAIVAIAPTLDVGTCSSIRREADPILADGTVAPWLIANVRNNMYALIAAGTIAVVVAAILAATDPRRPKPRVLAPHRAMFGSEPGSDDTFQRIMRLLGATVLFVIATAILVLVWDDFHELAHGYAAVAFFASLIAAVGFQAAYQWGRKPRWAKGYAAFAIAMAVVGVLAFVLDLGAHETFVLELLETLLFASYWLAQTVEKHRPATGGAPA